MAFVYILQSVKSGRYYIGSTNDLIRRLSEHRAGKTSSLRSMLPVELVFSKEYPSLLVARRMEKKLKRFKSRDIIGTIVSDGEIMSGL
jgi:putative endonuclease